MQPESEQAHQSVPLQAEGLDDSGVFVPNVPAISSAEHVQNADVEIMKKSLQNLELTINHINLELQEIKSNAAQKNNEVSMVSEINKGTESYLKPISDKLASLPEIVKKLSNINTASEGKAPISLKWLDYLFITVLVILVFLILNIFITAYVVRIIPR